MKTEIARLGAGVWEDDVILSRAAQIIKNGGLVAFPTETVYGLGANALDSTAAAKIYSAKGRPSDNPLIIHLAKAEDACKYAYVPDIYYKLAEAFLPGALTVVMKKRDNIPITVTGGLDSVAVRVPLNSAARRLIELSGVPIAAPSANLSGKPSPTKADHVIEDMTGRIDMIIDGGECDIGLESTIVTLAEDKAVLLRPGGVTVEMLESVLGHVELDRAVTQKLADGEKPLAPGMKYRHYAPSAPLTLIDSDDEKYIKFVSLQEDKEYVGVICYDGQLTALRQAGYKDESLLSLGDKSEEGEHLHRLFTLLRLCDKRDFKRAYAPLPKRDGMSLALYNRILKASGYTIEKL